MNELSLFSGAGGGVLGTKLLEWKHIGYVENNEYCQKVLRQRIKDGILDEAPIFGDIRAFISEGYAARYKGLVDVITAGFPCQPFSVAGKGLGEKDDRNMWPDTIECLRIIRPQFALFENVPGFLASGYCGTIFRDLAEAGYNARWCVLGAGDCGANHRRKRLWILGYSVRSGFSGQSWGRTRAEPENRYLQLEKADVSDTESKRLEGKNTEREQQARRRSLQYPERNWWSVEPDVGRVANGVASRVDRLKAIGNGQVPVVVATAWRLLTNDLDTRQ